MRSEKPLPSHFPEGRKEMASDFLPKGNAPKNHFPEGRKEMASDFLPREGNASLSKRERRKQGESKTPCYPSPTLPPTPRKKTDTSFRLPTVAEYAGTVARFLAEAGLTVDLTGGQNKLAAELDAFTQHIDQLAAERRRLESLEF